MKIIVWISKNIHRFVLIGLSAALCWQLYSLVVPQHVVVTCDNRLSYDMQQWIKERIGKTPVRSLGAQGIYNELKKECPCVSQVSISYKGPQVAYVQVKAQKPCVQFAPLFKNGTSSILTQAGSLVHKKYFNSDTIKGIFTIHVQTPEFLHHLKVLSSYTSLLALSPELFEQYKVVWCSKDEILLQSYFYENFVITADTASIHAKEKLVYAQRIYEQRKDAYKKGIRVDIRLKGSVVCGPLGGELNYEKSNSV